MKPYILVVDDEPDIRHLVRDILEDEGYEVSVAESGQSARRCLEERIPDLTLLDIWMPDVDGITLLKELHSAGYMAPVVMISGHGNVETAVEATRLGAFDFVEKPLSMGKLLSTVERAIAEGKRAEPEQLSVPGGSAEPVGHSDIMRNLRERAAKVAGQNNNVLLYGEPGTGKSIFAQYIHSLSPLAAAPFVSINLANMDGAEARRMLFGSDSQQAGAFSRAGRGTLYLNNINFADDGVQAELLDVLVRRNKTASSDDQQPAPRVIVSASEDLNTLVAEGTLAKELYFQLNELPIWIPPLRDHREDVPELLAHFVEMAIKEDHLSYRKFSFAAQNWLRNYAWPGNVLELRNLVRSLLVMGGDDEVSVEEVRSILGHGQPQNLGGTESQEQQDYDLPLREARDRFEKAYLEHHLREANGNVGVVARRAGMERTHLYRKFRSLGIDPKNVRKD